MLSYNQLSSLAELEDLTTVKKLDVSHNKIASLSGLSSLPLESDDFFERERLERLSHGGVQ